MCETREGDLPPVEEQDLLPLAVVALEGSLPGRMLEALGDSTLLRRLQKRGLLVSSAPGRSPHQDGSWEVPFVYRQQVLRRTKKGGVLPSAVDLGKRLLGAKSQAERWSRVLSGKLNPRASDERADPWLSAALRESITQPFDPIWLEETWGDRAQLIALHVLEEAQRTLAPCPRLPEWLTKQEVQEGLQTRAAGILSSQAALAGRFAEATSLAERATPDVRLAVSALSALVDGRLGAARLLARRAGSFQGASAPTPQLLPVVVLLLITSTQREDTQCADQLLAARSLRLGLGPALKLLRQMKKLRAAEGATTPRIPLPSGPGATAWEYLLSGLIVQAFSSHIWTRRAFQQALVDEALRYSDAGYGWMARQALVIACELDGEATRRRVESLGDLSLLHDLTRTGGDLIALPIGIPSWRRGLNQLVHFDKEPLSPRHAHRITWTVDLLHGQLTRPLLESYHRGRGFVPDERVELSELERRRLDLPGEDQRVVDLISKSTQPEVYGLEGLIGHPRVRSGLRSQHPVTVSVGTYAIETRREGSDVVIELSPSGLGVGLNVLRTGERGLELIRIPEEFTSILDTLKSGLRVPREHEAEALDALDTLSERLPVTTTPSTLGSSVPADTAPCLRITKCYGAFLVELGVRPFGPGGRFFAAGTGPQLVTGRRDGQRVRVARDFEREQARSESLRLSRPELDELHRSDDESASWLLSETDLLELVSALGKDANATIEWNETTPYRLAGSVSGAQLDAAIRPKRGWYLLAGKVAIDEVTELSLAELSALPATAKGRFVRLPSGEFVELDREVRRLLALATRDQSSLQLSTAQVFALSLGPARPWLDLPEQILRLRDNLDRALTVAAPRALHGELRPYQLRGFQWLHAMSTLGVGVCLADDMGLGKTLQVLAFMMTLEPGSRCLVIAPTSVCSNWLAETRKFAPTLGARPFSARLPAAEADRDASSPPSIVVASYSELTQNRKAIGEVHWDLVVLDEAQFIKNARSERAQACHALDAKMRIALSGTPIENHLGDLWSLFHFLARGLLGDYASFQTFYQKPIERTADPQATAELAAMVRPFILRRTKAEVLSELPDITRVRHEIELSLEEAKGYAALKKQISERIRSHLRNNKVEILAEITRLRRYCCHPRLVFPGASGESTKLEEFLDLATELTENGHQALVFSQYVDVLRLVRERLEELGLTSLTLDGRTSRGEREDRVNRFQAGKADFFLISLKAGGFGLNLTRADYVIHLDPWWNPAVMAQATDRAHRIGQDRPVVVYEFVTKQTIEEDVYALHERKQRLATSTLEEGAIGLQLSTSELRDWLKRAVEISEQAPVRQ